MVGQAALDTVVLEVTESSEQGVLRNGVENLFAEAVNLGIVAVSKIYSRKKWSAFATVDSDLWLTEGSVRAICHADRTNSIGTMMRTTE